MSRSILPVIRPVQLSDFIDSFRKALSEFAAAPGTSLCLTGVFVFAELAISTITWLTATTFCLILAAMGFPLIGALAAFGFYHIGRSKAASALYSFSNIMSAVWEALRWQPSWHANDFGSRGRFCDGTGDIAWRGLKTTRDLPDLGRNHRRC
ncbi:MAG: hypothetical protein AAF826_07620 [Pseudomonadota bacterium]